MEVEELTGRAERQGVLRLREQHVQRPGGMKRQPRAQEELKGLQENWGRGRRESKDAGPSL
jgi:hypothetical protein